MKYLEQLELMDGIYFVKEVSQVSYPEDGNSLCYQLEDNSYWFQHRNKCIAELVEKFEMNGIIADVGGGNGYVSKHLQDLGHEMVLIEPGLQGCVNARKRGVENVVCASLQDLEMHKCHFDQIGLFDVLEHIEDESEFLKSCYENLHPGGNLFLTVPSLKFLWSNEDRLAGHFRRYTIKTLRNSMESAGFKVRFISYLFSPLVLPIFFLRTIPSLFRRGNLTLKKTTSEHGLNEGLTVKILKRILSKELTNIKELRPINSLGSSCIMVAQK